jgi:hypothetical protein
MANVETTTATAVELELPPTGGNLSVVLAEDAHYLRVTLDKSENFKVAAGERLRDLLINKFNNNRNTLRDWYEEAVAQGKAHRAWKTVEVYLTVVLRHGDAAADVFADRDQRSRDEARERLTRHREQARAFRELAEGGNVNDIKATPRYKPQYDRRMEWLSDMNVLWFKGDPEWQDRWLKDRRLLRGRKF